MRDSHSVLKVTLSHTMGPIYQVTGKKLGSHQVECGFNESKIPIPPNGVDRSIVTNGHMYSVPSLDILPLLPLEPSACQISPLLSASWPSQVHG